MIKHLFLREHFVLVLQLQEILIIIIITTTMIAIINIIIVLLLIVTFLFIMYEFQLINGKDWFI